MKHFGATFLFSSREPKPVFAGATNELMCFLKPLSFKGGVGVGFGAANLLRC